MFIGHIGLGFAAKRLAPKAPLGLLLVAAEAVDVLAGLLVLLGIERMRPHPGITAMMSLEFVSYPWSHSLASTLFWATAAGLLAGGLRKDRRTGIVVGLLVATHWLLDYVSHRPDLPLLADGGLKVGLGLWNSVAGTLVVELGLMALGVALYRWATVACDRVGTWALVALVGFLTAIFFANHFGPPPPLDAPRWALALPTLSLVILWPWGNWIERHRVTTIRRR